MNRMLLVLLSTVALALVGCRKGEEESVVGSGMMTFTGRVGNGGIKTEIDNLIMKWSTDDGVVINGVDCTSELSGDRMTATFTGEVSSSPEYRAYYPLGLYDKENNKCVLSMTQRCNGENLNDLSGVNPMYAYSTTADLTFYSICALMRLVVRGTGTMKTITATADQPLSGGCVIDKETVGGTPYYFARVDANGARTVRLCCDTDVELNVTSAKTFYLALPQGEYTNLKFTLRDGDGGVYVSAPVSLKLTAGKVYTKELKGVSFVLPDCVLSNKFSVAKGKQVLFSRGSLYWNGGSFEFEDNQFGSGSISNGTWNTSHVPHFYYSRDMAVAYSEVYDDSEASDGDVLFTNDTETTPNPDFTVNGTAGIWRTLSNDEWRYMLNTRTMTHGKPRYTDKEKQSVTISGNSCKGVFIYPDDYNGTLIGTDDTTDTWGEIDALGIIYLRQLGHRSGTDIVSVGYYGDYWSSSPFGAEQAYFFNFGNDYVQCVKNQRSSAFSVRMVCDAD